MRTLSYWAAPRCCCAIALSNGRSVPPLPGVAARRDSTAQAVLAAAQRDTHQQNGDAQMFDFGSPSPDDIVLAARRQVDIPSPVLHSG